MQESKVISLETTEETDVVLTEPGDVLIKLLNGQSKVYRYVFTPETLHCYPNFRLSISTGDFRSGSLQKKRSLVKSNFE